MLKKERMQRVRTIAGSPRVKGCRNGKGNESLLNFPRYCSERKTLISSAPLQQIPKETFSLQIHKIFSFECSLLTELYPPLLELGREDIWMERQRKQSLEPAMELQLE